ncbi:ribosome biogenesis GTPase YlqF [Leeia sp. TBRC 13508]|uniref:Ribosome biogenesis GTPase A n=1 Tax=Leeia speluncae TaxID=2884804 RepID=A0ABS8D1Y2_9NEIS|nr:ribosome biogenesis GTPase YlqF [Leeia speluncae]MCB6182187.1 ribosome biogenesis GTPase YlqF [Leeia speluncae]
MAIQWFPGHMNAARKKAAETMEKTDMVIEVVDARMPHASRNPMLEEIRRHRQRPALLLLNKADVADPKVTKEWLDFYNKQPQTKAVAISCKKPADVARIPDLCVKVAPHRGTFEKPLRMMIMGIPNVGKSTLMNALLKKKVAAVGDEPAVTKSQQRLDINERMMITDTPGMLWPKISYAIDGFKLAASHTIGRNAYYEDEVAAYLGDYLLLHYSDLLVARYKGIDGVEDGVGLLEHIAKRRAFRIKGGELDIEKAAMTLLTDYRSGTLGKISLETLAEVEEMLATPPEPELEEEKEEDSEQQ